MVRTALATIGGLAVAGFLAAPSAAAQPDLTDRGWAYTGADAPAICQSVDANPTVDGFVETLTMVGQEGFSVYEASGIMIAALSERCPHNYWLVDAYVESSPPSPAKVLA